jgi:hypothetical protein
MRQIDNMTPAEIETLHLKGMLAEPTTMTREQKLEATLIGIKLALQYQGGYENTIAKINSALEP